MEKKEQVLNIYQRVHEVMKEISYIQKNTTVGSGNYSYKAVTHDHVVNLVRPYLIEYGIIIVPNQKEGKILQKKGEGGAKQMLYSASYTISFINIDDPADSIDIDMVAHAQDSGDKAPGKTLTYAVKMAILKLFYLETGINDEERAPEEKESKKTLTESQISEIVTLTAGDTDLMLKICNAYKVKYLEEIEQKNLPSILNRLSKNLERQNNDNN